MGFNCGIVGLPNVGKSTLFNALTATQAAQAANYPFCTIEPNVGRVAVPDARLQALATVAKSAKIVPTQLEFVDIAGLVRGASQGQGLGNQFLSHIRQVDAIVQVLRCFDDDDITHVEGGVNPLRDADIIDIELILCDLDQLEKKRQTVSKKATTGDAEAKAWMAALDPAIAHLSNNHPLRTLHLDADAKALIASLQVLTLKPMMWVANVAEHELKGGNKHLQDVQNKASHLGVPVVVISAQIEAELAQLSSDDQKAYLADLGMTEPALDRLIHQGYSLLNLLTFFTVGPKETHAWTVHNGAKAPQAAGVIHTDFERGFIRAEVIGYNDYIANNGEVGAKEAGKMRLEGKEYIVKDGDIMLFRFNV